VPTAEDYDIAAAAFDSVRGRLPTLLTTVESHLSAIVGGQLRMSLDRLVVDSQHQVTSCRSQLDDVVDLCRTRAALIRELETAERAYRTALDQFLAEESQWLAAVTDYEAAPLDHRPPGPAPRRPGRPDPPPAWAELRP